jgi:hypothetical protein
MARSAVQPVICESQILDSDSDSDFDCLSQAHDCIATISLLAEPHCSWTRNWYTLRGSIHFTEPPRREAAPTRRHRFGQGFAHNRSVSSMARTLFCTVSDNRFAPGCRVMLHSLQRHFGGFDQAKVKVFFDSAMSPLSDGAQHSIRQVVPSVQFVEVQNPVYRTAKVRHERLRPAYLSLEAFRETEYDHVFYVDADMLCTRDFSHLPAAEEDCDFMACAAWRDAHNPYHRVGLHQGCWARRRWFGVLGRRRLTVNAGFFWIGKALRTPEMYRALQHHVACHSSRRGLADQWAINSFFGTRTTRLSLLPDDYNWRDLSVLDTSPMAELPTILHYVGGRQQPKPWLPGAPRDLAAYRLWQQYAADGDLAND